MFWKSKKKQLAWPLAGLRETLFGDLPMDRWPPPDPATVSVEPWATFALARDLVRSDHDGAVRHLRSVLVMPGLEPRHHLQAWHFLRELGIHPGEDVAKAVLGVVVEVPVDGGLDVLAAYADRSARYLNHAGGAVVWERPDGRLDAPIDALLDAARVLVGKIGPWEGPRPPVPRREHARLNILTPSGLHFGEAPFDALAADPIGAPVIDAATTVMQQIVEIGLSRPSSGPSA